MEDGMLMISEVMHGLRAGAGLLGGTVDEE